MTVNAAIQSKLTDAKYPDLLLAKFDSSKLSTAKDGTVLGIDAKGYIAAHQRARRWHDMMG